MNFAWVIGKTTCRAKAFDLFLCQKAICLCNSLQPKRPQNYLAWDSRETNEIVQQIFHHGLVGYNQIVSSRDSSQKKGGGSMPMRVFPMTNRNTSNYHDKCHPKSSKKTMIRVYLSESAYKQWSWWSVAKKSGSNKDSSAS